LEKNMFDNNKEIKNKIREEAGVLSSFYREHLLEDVIPFWVKSDMLDKENGEWYGYLHRDGTVSHTQKGSMWKGPYHLPRALMLCEFILGEIASGNEASPIL